MALKRCKTSFAVTLGGRPTVVQTGQLVDDSDPLYKGREELFEDVTATVSSEPKRVESKVEQATAAPGEKRRVGRPAKSQGAESKQEG